LLIRYPHLSDYAIGKGEFISHKNIKEIEYVIRPEFDSDWPKLNVDLYIRFKKKPKRGKLYIAANDTLANIKNIHKDIKNIKLLTIKARLKDTEKPNNKLIENITQNTVYINYKVTCPVRNLEHMTTDNEFFRPLVSKDYFQIIGHNSLIIPAWGNQTPNYKFKFRFNWKNIPKNWKLLNSFGYNQKKQKKIRSIKNILNSVHIAGDFRVKKIEIEDQPVYVAIRSIWPIKDNEFFNIVEKVVKEQRKLFDDYDFPHYLVIALPIGNHVLTRGCASFHNTFLSFLGTWRLPVERLAKHISHENFHIWNGKKIKMSKPEELLYWFSEGFTDYYAYLTNLRAGLITFQDYVNYYNYVLYAYWTSPVRNSSNTQILKDFWNNIDIAALPYHKGQILAHNWNTRIKKETGDKYSLDDVIRDILKEVREHKQPFTVHLLDQVVKKYMKKSILGEIKKYIDNGETILPDPDTLGPCCALEWIKAKNVYLGARDDNKNGENIIIEVDKNSNAYKAGIRKGQILLGVLNPWGIGPRADRLSRLKIKDLDGTIKNVELYPVGQKEFDVPQYAIKKKCIP